MDFKKNPLEKHKDYIKYQNIWQRNNDFCEGQDAVKEQGTAYLPSLPSQQYKKNKKGESLYDIYKNRAMLWPGAKITKRVWTGEITRKKPDTNAPQDYIDVFTLLGDDIDTAAMNAIGGLIQNDVYGFLVDFQGGRSISIQFEALDILNWDYKILNGQYMLSELVLVLERDDSDIITKVGHYYLDESLNCWYEESDNKRDMTDPVQIIAREKPLEFIPFVPITMKGRKIKLSTPMITEVVNINQAHYQNDADYRNALGIAGKPTPCVKNALKPSQGSELVMGTSQVWEFGDNGEWGFLGLDDSSGIVALEKASQDLKVDMAIAGSRALLPDPNGVEAAETARIRRTGETSQLSLVADRVSAGITQTLQIMDFWETGAEMNTENSLYYDIPVDFDSRQIDSQTLATLLNMYTLGKISFEVYWYNLIRGEMVPDGWTGDDEMETLKKNESVPDLISNETQDTIQTETNGTILNGAQIKEAGVFVEKVALGQLPREQAIELILLLGVPRTVAEKIVPEQATAESVQ